MLIALKLCPLAVLEEGRVCKRCVCVGRELKSLRLCISLPAFHGYLGSVPFYETEYPTGHPKEKFTSLKQGLWEAGEELEQSRLLASPFRTQPSSALSLE